MRIELGFLGVSFGMFIAPKRVMFLPHLCVSGTHSVVKIGVLNYSKENNTQSYFHIIIPLKTNISPENWCLEDDMFSFWSLFRSYVNFPGGKSSAMSIYI